MNNLTSLVSGVTTLASAFPGFSLRSRLQDGRLFVSLIVEGFAPLSEYELVDADPGYVRVIESSNEKVRTDLTMNASPQLLLGVLRAELDIRNLRDMVNVMNR